jgi:hypothetical protein
MKIEAICRHNNLVDLNTYQSPSKTREEDLEAIQSKNQE